MSELSVSVFYDNQTTSDHDFLEIIEQSITETLRFIEFEECVELSVKLVSKDEIKELNNHYRSKDLVTDVLSFTQFDEEGEFEAFEDEPIWLGDIVICLDIAIEQADRFGHTTEREIGYLVCHSTLHLMGYDHLIAEEKANMRSVEKAVMKQLGLSIHMED